jgi:hypothetical protein
MYENGVNMKENSGTKQDVSALGRLQNDEFQEQGLNEKQKEAIIFN